MDIISSVGLLLAFFSDFTSRHSVSLLWPYSLHPQGLCIRYPFFMSCPLSSPSITTLLTYLTFYLSFRTQLTVYCLGEVSLTSSHGPSNLLCWILCFASTYTTFINDCLTTRLWAPWERPGSMYILSILVFISSSAPGIQRSFNMFDRMKKTINEIKWHYRKLSIINPYSKLYIFNTGT